MLAIGFLNLAIGLLTTVLLAQLLPRAGYGEYVLALSVASIAALPVELGLPTLMMREIARFRAEDKNELIAAIIAWVLAFVSCSFVFIAVAFLVYYITVRSEKVSECLQILSMLLLLPLALMNWARGILQGFDKPVQFALPDSIFRPVLLLIFVGLLVVAGALSPMMVMAAHVTAVSLCFWWSISRAAKILRSSGVRWRFNRSDLRAREWLASLLPITLVSGVRVVNRRIDIVIVGALSSTATVAVYNVSLQITSVVLVAQTILNQSLGPKVAMAHHKGNTEQLRREIAASSIISASAAVIFSATIILGGKWAIPRIFGEDYAHSYSLVCILCLGQLFSALMGPTALLLNMSRLEGKTLRTGILSAIVGISLAALLVPPLHGVGAAIAASATLVAIQAQRWWMVKEHIGVRCDIFSAVSFLFHRT
ncbi:oligosaccharide flippase family protein [Tsuneonella deserti]|nr:oligosaccharide flippase family protein [Tsuneonella deserti]